MARKIEQPAEQGRDDAHEQQQGHDGSLNRVRPRRRFRQDRARWRRVERGIDGFQWIHTPFQVWLLTDDLDLRGAPM
jgi:hypothetical protein